ncbi:MAG: transglycosylase SLT domain-containing protein, partial [Gammaproteobacteria bacterium]|nr:transglycosylase SLT domain-containing protein [Gammaproteobacteria bacterium]
MRSLLKEQLITSRLLVVCTLFLGLPGCLTQMAVKADPDTETVIALLPAINEIIAPIEPEPTAELCAFETSTDLWERIRQGYALEDHDHKGVESDQAWYARHQAYLDRVVERASPYLHLIVEAIEERDMPAEIALLPVVESAFQPFAYSHGRAAGLWQFIPGTGR